MWPLLGAAVGTGLELYGNQQKSQAMGQAQGQYTGALNNFYGQQQGNELNEQQQAQQLDQQRLGALSSMVGQYTAPTAAPATYQAAQNAAITKGGAMDAKLGDPTVTPNGGAAASLQDRLNQFYGSQIQRNAQARSDQLTWGGQNVQQNQAEAGFNLADQQLGNRLQSLERMSSMAQAQGQVQLGNINTQGQANMYGAQGAGNSWLQAGALLGGVSALGNMGGKGAQAPGGMPQQNPNGQWTYSVAPQTGDGVTDLANTADQA